MYVAAVRMADDFGCAAIGIQYQQGLKDICVASDLAEGLLNNPERPPVRRRRRRACSSTAGPLPHFNEVDECAGLDALVTNRVWTRPGLDPVEHAARRAVGRGRCRTRRRRVRLGVRDLRRRAASALHRRLGRRDGRAPAAHVLPARRLHAQGRQQARRDRLEPHLRRRTTRSAWTSAAAASSAAGARRRERRWQRPRRRSGRSCTRPLRRLARSDDGPAQGQPHPGRLRARSPGARSKRWSPRRRWRGRWASR